MADSLTLPAPPFATAEVYAQIVEASPSGLLHVAPDGRIMLVNRRIEAMFGYDRAELLGQPAEMLVPERFRGGGQCIGSGDLVGLRRDGREFPIEIDLNPIVADGIHGTIAAVQDITARHEASLGMERQRQELQRSNADLAEFAHAASHDLKAPLRGMAHLADWIAEDIGETASPQTLENCALLRARAMRMQALLDGLLAYARAGRVLAPPETFDTAEMVRDLVATLALPGGFTVTLAGEMPTITAERMPLERVLQNLIETAVKHHDRRIGRILVSASRDKDRIRFSVGDDGPGIPPRYHDRIFQVFQTLNRRDDVEASGIGLSIVKKKVEVRGGRVTVESAPPQRGTRFTFTWPELPAA